MIRIEDMSIIYLHLYSTANSFLERRVEQSRPDEGTHKS